MIKYMTYQVQLMLFRFHDKLQVYFCIKTTVSRIVALCNIVRGYERFGETCQLSCLCNPSSR
jgi:hypothetical protein